MVDYNPSHVSILTQKSYPPSRMRTYSSSNRLLPRSSFMSSLEDDLVSLTVSSSPQSRRDSLRGSFKMGNRGNQNAIGTDWTVELACLKQSSSIFEVRHPCLVLVISLSIMWSIFSFPKYLNYFLHCTSCHKYRLPFL